MLNIKFKLKELYYCIKGQGMIEYILLVALIALVLVATLTLFGDALSNAYNNISNLIKNT